MPTRKMVAHGFSPHKREVVVYDRVVTAANLMTFVGIVATVAYIFLFVTNSFTGLILPLVILVALTDLFDGLLASWNDEHTMLGSILDPVRDRLITIALLVNMLFFSDIGLVLLILLIVCAELGLAVTHISKVREVHLIGKIRFLVHLACGLQFVLQTYSTWWPWNVNVGILMLVMLNASVVSLLFYALSYHKEATQKRS